MTNKSGRYFCDIFSNMRKCYETRNFSYLLALIEEGQYRAERMESAVESYGDLERLEKKRAELKDEIRELRMTKKSEGKHE